MWYKVYTWCGNKFYTAADGKTTRAPRPTLSTELKKRLHFSTRDSAHHLKRACEKDGATQVKNYACRSRVHTTANRC
ncbi:uncharacterized [Tachysurus ichikawai]